MTVRRAIVAVAIVLVALPFSTRSSAVATKVGGAAWGVGVGSPNGQGLTLSNSGLSVLNHGEFHPLVTLDPQGDVNGEVAEIPGFNSNQASFAAAHVRIHGTLAGTPYAEAHAIVLGLNVQQRVFRALETSCRWDTAGVSGETKITLPHGGVIMPSINYPIYFPGGRIVLNEQIPHTLSDGSKVLTVSGAHLYVDRKVSLAGLTITPAVSLTFAVSSCDPDVGEIVRGGLTLISGG